MPYPCRQGAPRGAPHSRLFPARASPVNLRKHHKIPNLRIQSEIPANGAAAQSACRHRQSPCTRETGRHGRASPSCVADERQSGSFGTRAHTHDDHEHHPGAPAARAVCFPAEPGRAASMLYPCPCRAPVIRRSRSPGAPQNPQSANSGRTSRKRLQTRQRHKACANAVSPPASRKNRQSAFIRRAWTTMGFRARSRSIPSMPYRSTRGVPTSAPRIPGRASTNPEKSPICRRKPEFPARKVMHRGLRLFHKSPMVQSLARKTALLTPVSSTG